jgi:hypothetical protein
MRMVVGAALSWPHPGRGIVVDCSGLAYRGGDDFFLWLDLPARFGFPPDRFRVALIIGEQNEVAIRSLIVDQQIEEFHDHCFLNLSAAIDWICQDIN